MFEYENRCSNLDPNSYALLRFTARILLDIWSYLLAAILHRSHVQEKNLDKYTYLCRAKTK